jgi:hypothetical protein
MKKRLLIIGELFFGILLGFIFVTPKTAGDVFGGIFIGLIISTLFIYFTFPELRESQQSVWMGNSFTHPTRIPIWIGGVWFFVSLLSWAVFISFFPAYARLNAPFTLLIALCPFFAAFGYSGYLMIKRNETVGNFGYIHRGFWAYVSGVIVIICSWGGLLLILYVLYLLEK